VPQWYQRRFLNPGQDRYYYLDLAPEVLRSGGVTYRRNDWLQWGPKRCFKKDDLYALKLGKAITDVIEQRFFGRIDTVGESAVRFFSAYRYRDETHDAFDGLTQYMGAQRFRTPRGLDFLKLARGTGNHNAALTTMGRIFRYHATMWSEGIWEVVGASASPTKFIVSDGPVTFYNPGAFPGAPECRYPQDVPLERIGTRTIFPLGMESCLIITHLQLVRDPWLAPGRPRTNARAFETTMMDLTDIQFGRELEEDEVRRVNYILKKRASRYVAAAEAEWLHPEQHLATTAWNKLDADWFLLPNLYKVDYKTGLFWGDAKGRAWGQDEFGRRPGQPGYDTRRPTKDDFERHLQAREAWALKRRGRSLARVEDYTHKDTAADHLMQRFLERGSGAEE
jgi:hypothetical protein